MFTISWKQTAASWALMFVHTLWCLRFDKQTALTWFIASLRATVQLFLLGFILSFLIKNNAWGFSFLAATVMLVVSAITTTRRTRIKYRALLLDCLIAILVSTGGILLTLMLFMPEALKQLFFFLPFLGILLGNAISGIALGVSRWLSELKVRYAEIEALLAVGASKIEALHPFKTIAIQTAMTAILNSMSVAGIVSIPGVMTGQVLAGSLPDEAAKYQLVVLFLIASVVFGSFLLVLALSTYRLVDRWGAVRTNQLTEDR